MSKVPGRPGREYDTDDLPKWASGYIERLERDLAWAREQLAAGPEDSNTFAEPYSDVPRPLGRDPVIRFEVTPERRFEAYVRNGRLVVQLMSFSHRDEPVIMPCSSNTVHLGFIRHEPPGTA